MWKDEGWRGFMKGNGINVVRVSFVLVFHLSHHFIGSKLIERPMTDIAILSFTIHSELPVA